MRVVKIKIGECKNVITKQKGEKYSESSRKAKLYEQSFGRCQYC